MSQVNKLSIIKRAIEQGFNVAVIGPHGIGKTQAVLHVVREELPQFKPVYASVAQMSKDDLLAPFPVEKHDRRWVTYLPHEIFDSMCDDGVRRPIVLILDEFNRNITDPQIYNALLEAMTDGVRTMAGVKLDLHSFVALMNPSDDDTYFNTSELELPVLDRFHLFVEVDQYDLGADMYLLQKYPDHAGAVIEWYLSLPQDKRKLVPPRRQEAIIKCHLAGFPVSMALPRDTQLPVQQLQEVLNGGTVWTLKRLLDQPELAAQRVSENHQLIPLFVALLRTVNRKDQARRAFKVLLALPPAVRTGLATDHPLYFSMLLENRSQLSKDELEELNKISSGLRMEQSP